MNEAKFGTALERMADITMAMGLLDDEISALTDAVGMVEDKTRSVRRPYPATISSDTKEPEEVLAPLADLIKSQSMRVREARTRLRQMESHIEL